jgi:hypothetical protein
MGAAQKATEPYWINSLRFITREAKQVGSDDVFWQIYQESKILQSFHFFPNTHFKGFIK